VNALTIEIENILDHKFNIDFEDRPLHKIGIDRYSTLDLVRRIHDQFNSLDWNKKFHLLDLPPGGGKTYAPTILSYLIHRQLKASNHFYVAPNSSTYGSVANYLLNVIRWNLEDGKSVILLAKLKEYITPDIQTEYELLKSQYPGKLVLSNDAESALQFATIYKLGNLPYIVYGVCTEQYIFDQPKNAEAWNKLIGLSVFTSIQIDEPHIAFAATCEENYEKNCGSVSVPDPFKRPKFLYELQNANDNMFVFATTGTASLEHKKNEGFDSIFKMEYIHFHREPFAEFTKDYTNIRFVIPKDQKHYKLDLKEFAEIVVEYHTPGKKAMVKAQTCIFNEIIEKQGKRQTEAQAKLYNKCMFYTAKNGLHEIVSGKIVKFGDGTLEYARSHLENGHGHKDILVIDQAAREGFDCKSIQCVMYLAPVVNYAEFAEHYGIQQFNSRACRKSEKYGDAEIVMLWSNEENIISMLTCFAINLFGKETSRYLKFMEMVDDAVLKIKGPNLYSNQDLVDAALDKAFLS